MQKRLNNRGSISLFELLIILVIVFELIFLLTDGFGWYNKKFSTGSDALYLNTCESVAKVNSLDGTICPVNGCGNSDGTCIHHNSRGYVGYFDSVSNTVVASKVRGYNLGDNPSIDGKQYNGEKGTLILRVMVYDGTIYYDWVKGND